MKLEQHVRLLNDYSLTTWLSKANKEVLDHEHIGGPIELSFHPFNINIYAQEILKEVILDEEISFEWLIRIEDDEEGKALLSFRSENRALLLLSEILEGIFEALAYTSFTMVTIKPNKGMLDISLSMKKNSKAADLIMGSVLLCVVLDSLLFCRGLRIGHSAISFKGECRYSSILQAIYTHMI